MISNSVSLFGEVEKILDYLHPGQVIVFFVLQFFHLYNESRVVFKWEIN